MGVGDLEERIERNAGRRAPRKMVELQPSKRVSRGTFLFSFVVVCALAAGIVVLRRDDKDARPATAKEAAETAAEPPRDPDITMTDVGGGVFHLEFGGYCDDAQCLKRAAGLVLERSPGRRIVSIAPLGAYGSALAIVTAPAQ